MKNKSIIIKIILISLIVNLSSPLFAQKKIEEEIDETPQVMKDLRRFEIITLGALPFVILDSTLVYSGIKYAQNDFNKEFKPGFSQSNFTKDEQKGVLLTSLGICLGIGITDLIINIVKRNNAKKRQAINEEPIYIMPLDNSVEENDEVILLENTDKISNNEAAENEE